MDTANTVDPDRELLAAVATEPEEFDTVWRFLRSRSEVDHWHEAAVIRGDLEEFPVTHVVERGGTTWIRALG